ncbi:hypothetical protein HAX54_052184 [Datura stramonium]|uniref:Uncharacterized protein n=1 Tax=Datura stramonium TaxID=4076 RepID=A0ABS8T0E1_DATST|nr:hypothetical protein [Datura stramonium]
MGISGTHADADMAHNVSSNQANVTASQSQNVNNGGNINTQADNGQGIMDYNHPLFLSPTDDSEVLLQYRNEYEHDSNLNRMSGHTDVNYPSDDMQHGEETKTHTHHESTIQNDVMEQSIQEELVQQDSRYITQDMSVQRFSMKEEKRRLDMVMVEGEHRRGCVTELAAEVETFGGER